MRQHFPRSVAGTVQRAARGLARRPEGRLVMIDGTAWLKELMEQPGAPVLLEHGEAVALAGAQPMQAGQRMSAAIAGIAAAA